MIICKLSDQLGNQMFAYASVKSIALDKGYDFKILGEYNNQFLKNDTDKKYGNTLTSIFADICKRNCTRSAKWLFCLQGKHNYR